MVLVSYVLFVIPTNRHLLDKTILLLVKNYPVLDVLLRLIGKRFCTDKPLEFRIRCLGEEQRDTERVDHESGHDGIG